MFLFTYVEAQKKEEREENEKRDRERFARHLYLNILAEVPRASAIGLREECVCVSERLSERERETEKEKIHSMHFSNNFSASPNEVSSQIWKSFSSCCV